MQRDVIMPALGMAQDTGKITSWLKAAGDAVAPGDPLFEVETDKATMEVEAQIGGFLTNVTAAAGDDVPVGNVIALISETAGETAVSVATSPAANEPTDSPDDSQLPDGTNIIMPVLGMAQDSGKLVSWNKALGDEVAADDVLFEVETDKSTMEVPAGADGYLAAIMADAGEDVPTGQTIAIITANKPDQTFSQSATKADAPTPAAPAPKAVAPIQAAAISVPTVPRNDGRILASPKARRLALAAGLDLARLVSAGHPQPYHAADIDVLRNLPTEGSNAVNSSVASRQITARVPSAGTDDFIAWMLEDAGITVAPSALWASFASGALRATNLDITDLNVQIAPLNGDATTRLNPDQSRLSNQIETTDTPNLILRDLTDSHITGLNLGPADAPTITIARDGDTLCLSLDFTANQLDDAAAIALITGFATRLADPLYHLL
ncbi:putative dihydrolipoyllysine-residue acetyltransferase [Octadecabacter antarcticus 307]|uniref:Putative dihydrolipoyllysine-residue acetyltransferase n=1 Tax=Octadecabacter antarcticus 307 TaxID=391626 RepID=M9R8L9_9RHOB|nr:biotin/lipoyl-containing protein [Octadecabacter antarcticus]AGI68979.1 putative dihydrolipoyllysine-residue acetyltransferase [Octadecabacter antarcticus 307]